MAKIVPLFVINATDKHLSQPLPLHLCEWISEIRSRRGIMSATLPELGILTAAIRELTPPLPRATATRVVVIGCGVKIHFPWEKTRRTYQSAVRQIQAAINPAVTDFVAASDPFEDPSAMVEFLDGQLGSGIAGIILVHAAYTAGEIGCCLGRWLLDHPTPLLSWSVPDEPAERLEANSLCCQNFILNMLRTMGVKYAWIHAPIDSSVHVTVAQFCRTARARYRFRFGKVLHIGGSRVTAFYDGEADELAVMKRFGLRYDRIDLEAAFQYARRFRDSDLRHLRDTFVQSPQCARNDVPDEQMFQTLRLGMTALHMAAENGYIGCVIKSWPDLFDQYGCAADGAVSMLNDIGVCTAEEGEMNGLLSSLSLYLLSDGGAIPTMMDLSVLDSANNRLGIWHCGASPTRLLKNGSKFEARRHSILENANRETAVGLMVEFLLELGPVTVLRYQSPSASKAFAFQGDLVDVPMRFRGVYGEMEPKAPATATQIVGTILDHGLDHHWSLGYGYWAQDLTMLHHWLNVTEVPLRASYEASGIG